MKPHRATTVLLLGILSLVVCAPIGFAAWIMGNHDLRDMNSGLMDPSGRETTSAGRICGMIGSIISILVLIGAIVMFVILGVAGVATVKSEQERMERQRTEMAPAPDPAR